jgi:hypothetical protein
MSVATVVSEQKERNREDSVSFYLFPFLKMSLRVTVCKVPDGGLQAVNGCKYQVVLILINTVR